VFVCSFTALCQNILLYFLRSVSIEYWLLVMLEFVEIANNELLMLIFYTLAYAKVLF